MKVKVERESPDPPPISQVVIYLTADEALKLKNLFGSLSRAKIRSALSFTGVTGQNFSDDQVEDTFHVTAGIYSKMNEQMTWRP